MAAAPPSPPAAPTQGAETPLPGSSPTATLILHPITREVYEVPASQLLFNSQMPVRISSAMFQTFAHEGGVNVDKFVSVCKNDQGEITGFNVDEVAAVKLRPTITHFNPMTWATRVSVEVGEPVLPESSRFDDLDREAGGRFLFLWPTLKAFATYVTRMNNAQRSNQYSDPHPVDDLAPTSAYESALKGGALGPDDIPGCVRVDPAQLSERERVFVAMMNTADSLFLQRKADDRWSQGVVTKTRTRQEQSIAHVVQTFQSIPYDRDPLDWMEIYDADYTHAPVHAALPYDESDAAAPETRDLFYEIVNAGDLDAKARLAVSNCGKMEEEEVEQAKKRRRLDASDGARGARVNTNMSRLQAAGIRLLSLKLPAEITVKIMGHVVTESLVYGDANKAARAFCTVRSLCRSGRALADQLLGHQLEMLQGEMHQMWFWNCRPRVPARPVALPSVLAPALPAPHLVGARARALHISCSRAFELPFPTETTRPPGEGCANGWPVAPRSVNLVNLCIAYFKERRAYERIVGKPKKRRGRSLAQSIANGDNVATARQLRHALERLNPTVHSFSDAGQHAQRKSRHEGAVLDVLHCDPAQSMLRDGGIGG